MKGYCVVSDISLSEAKDILWITIKDVEGGTRSFQFPPNQILEILTEAKDWKWKVVPK